MTRTLLQVLEEHFGYSEFRFPQQEIMESILKKQDVLAILPTGKGKSLCFQLPTFFLDGLTLVISPLLSLMHDQVQQSRSRGIETALWSSETSPEEVTLLKKKIRENSLKLLYLSPEKLWSKDVTWTLLSTHISHLCVDEAHCISQWGHDFRPEYLQIARFIDEYQKKHLRPVVSAVTATATQQVVRDIFHGISLKNSQIFQLPYYRENLQYEVLFCQNEAEKRKLLSLALSRWKRQDLGSCLLYCSTRAETEFYAQWCTLRGYTAHAFHAGLKKERKKQLLQKFLNERKTLFVATSAFGMGIHHDNIRKVIHLSAPSNLLAYAQESGRAGRDSQPASCLLLYRPEDLRQTYEWLVQRCHTPEQIKKLKNEVETMHRWAISTKEKSLLLKNALTPDLRTFKNLV